LCNLIPSGNMAILKKTFIDIVSKKVSAKVQIECENIGTI